MKTFYPEEYKDMQSVSTENLITELGMRAGLETEHKENINFSAVSDTIISH